MFSAMFSSSGTINMFLSVFGVEGPSWLMEYAMPALIIVNIWEGTSFSMLMYQSALDGISDSQLEAAVIDGCSRAQTIYHIILPNIKHTIATNSVLVTLQTVGLFGMIYALTGGGPGMATTTIPVYTYKTALVSGDLSFGVAASMMLLLLGMILSLVYMRLFKQEN
jgi:multiple sugar transport system permease protein